RRASADSHGVGGWSRCGTSVLVPSRLRALARLAEDELGGQLVTRHPQPVRGRAARSGAAAPAWTASAPTTASAPDSPSGTFWSHPPTTRPPSECSTSSHPAVLSPAATCPWSDATTAR